MADTPNGTPVAKAATPEFADQTFERERGKRVKATTTVGQAGFAVYGGYIQTSDKHTDLIGQRRWTTFGELLANVSIVAAGVRHVLNLVGKAGWTVVPAEDGGARAQEIADLVESMLYDMATPWHRIVKRIATYAFYGFSVQEWVAKKRDDGVIGLHDVESRAQHSIERWDTDTSGTVHGVEQRAPQGMKSIYIPRAKIVYAVDDSLTDSPEGLGLLRHVAPTAKRLQTYERLEGFGFETDLRGIPVGRAPYAALQEQVASAGITKPEADARLAVLENFVQNHVRTEATGIVLDSITYQSVGDETTPSNVYQWGLDVIRTDSAGQEHVAHAISRLARDIARILGVEGLLVGETGAGSLAMLREKNNVMGILIDGMLVDVGLTIEKDLLEPLFLLNGWPPELLPTLQPEKLQLRALDEITAAIKDLAQAGAVLAPDDPAINAVRTVAGLPSIDLERAAEDADLMRSVQIAALGRGGKDATDQEPKPVAADPDEEPTDTSGLEE